MSIDCDVPQGSIISPLLFIIYMNDIINSCNLLKFVLYADDTSVLHTSDNVNILINMINIEMMKVCARFEANHLSFNPNKTSYLVFH